MTSKNFFLAKIVQNIKERLWVVIAVFGIFFIEYPVVLVLSLNEIKNRTGYKLNDISLEYGRVIKKSLEINHLAAFLVALVAVMMGIQAMSYLNNKNKVDFYKSIPENTWERFAVIELASLIIFAFMLALNGLLGMLVGMGFYSEAIYIPAMLKAFIYYVLLYLAYFNLAGLATILTGNVVVSILAAIVLAVYEAALKGMIWELSENFLNTFYSGRGFFRLYFTPYYYIYQIVEGSKVALNTISLVVLILGLMLLALLTLMKRPMESAGNGLAFEKTKLPIKLCILSLAEVFGGTFFYAVTGSRSGILMMVFGVILAGIIGHIIVQIIYEADIRGVTRGIAGTVVTFAISIAILLVFRYDLTGYDRYIPKGEKIRAIAVDTDVSPLRTVFVDYETEQTTYWNMNDRLERQENMDKDALLQLAENSDIPQWYIEYSDKKIPVTFRFELTNGRNVYRVREVNLQDNSEILDKIFSAEEYKNITCQPYNETFPKDSSLMGSYVDMFYEGEVNRFVELDKEETLQLHRCMRNDMKSLKFSELVNKDSVGGITFYSRGETKNYDNTWYVRVFESMEETVNYINQVQENNM